MTIEVPVQYVLRILPHGHGGTLVRITYGTRYRYYGCYYIMPAVQGGASGIFNSTVTSHHGDLLAHLCICPSLEYALSRVVRSMDHDGESPSVILTVQ